MREDYIQTIRKKIGTDMLLVPTVDCLLMNNNNELLLQLRSDTHTWGIPGGMIELNETVQEALAREVQEETGFHIQNPILFGIYSGASFQITYSHGDKISPVKIVFVANTYTGILTKEEESKDLQFFKRTELPENIHTTHKHIIDDYFLWSIGKLTIPHVE